MKVLRFLWVGLALCSIGKSSNKSEDLLHLTNVLHTMTLKMPPKNNSTQLSQQDEEILKNFLQEHDFSEITSTHTNGQTPLHVALAEKNITVARLLISKGANVNTPDKNEYTPLYSATVDGEVEIAKLLIANKANVNVTNKYGWTPLHMAASKGQVEIAKLLIANKANVNSLNNDNWTPLHVAAVGEQAEIVKLLIDAGADKTLTIQNGETAYDLTLDPYLKNLLKPQK